MHGTVLLCFHTLGEVCYSFSLFCFLIRRTNSMLLLQNSRRKPVSRSWPRILMARDVWYVSCIRRRAEIIVCRCFCSSSVFIALLAFFALILTILSDTNLRSCAHFSLLFNSWWPCRAINVNLSIYMSCWCSWLQRCEMTHVALAIMFHSKSELVRGFLFFNPCSRASVWALMLVVRLLWVFQR